MKITPLTIDFDVTNAQEVEFVNELLNRIFGGAPLKATAASTENPVNSTSAPLKATAAPTENPVNSTSVPTFSGSTQTAAPVQEVKEEVKEEPKQETITEAIAEVRREMKKPVKVDKPMAAKEAPQATIEPKPVQAPTEEEKAPEKASKEPLTAKDMQTFMMDLMRSGKITRPQLTDIMLEFGGASLMSIKPEKYELLKQRIETYND